MNRTIALGLAAICCLSADSAAHADRTSYSFSASHPSLFFEDNRFGGFALTQRSGVLPASVTTTPVTIGTNLLAFSLAPKSDPQELYAPINLTLRNKTSSGTTLQQTVHLGVLFGPLYKNGSDLVFQSFGPKTINFGQHTYKITFASDAIYSTNLHDMGLFLSQGRLAVTVSDPPGGPSSATTPEPSSFVLAGIGVPLLSLFLRRRRV
jgi:hypothetical protein